MSVGMVTWLRRLFGGDRRSEIGSTASAKCKHDYEMVFPDEGSLRYELVCRCGDKARDMNDALRKMVSQ